MTLLNELKTNLYLNQKTVINTLESLVNCVHALDGTAKGIAAIQDKINIMVYGASDKTVVVQSNGLNR